MANPPQHDKYQEFISQPGVKDCLGFLNGHMNPELSNLKGKAYVYRMTPEYAGNPRMQQMEQMKAVNSFMTGTHMFQQPYIKYPYATHRVAGRMWPGEVERRLRKTKQRKATRAQAEMLCKFMLFKKGKFMPGKLV